MAVFPITCPYCFEKFFHTDVHFRMETYFDENELNDQSYSESEVLRMAESPRKQALLAQIRKRKPFLRRDDPQYTEFWEVFGKTTERTTGVDKKLPFPVYQLPILDPGSAEAQDVLKVQRPSVNGERSKQDYFIYDGDGMVVAIEDICSSHPRTTYRRLCPKCHNPLPLGFGKHPLKFISVIGVTGAGKTVYISQMLKNMNRYASYVDMAAFFTSDHEINFVEDNPVEVGKPLPRPTMQGQLAQPMFYDLVQTTANGQVRTDTIIIYDIAGESCQNAADMQKYGEFVTKSDGIILLVDPSQLDLVVGGKLGENVRSAEPERVINTIYNAFVEKNSHELQDIPIAVCISKSDSFQEILPDVASRDINPVVDGFSDENLPKFNASEYNQLQPEIMRLMRNNPLVTSLKNKYRNFNFFIFSATGCAVEDRVLPGEMQARSYPVAPPIPRRIAEPLLWLFYKFGYIGSDVPIRLPFPRKCPETIPVPKNGLLGRLGKTTIRPLTEEEKERYRYEERC